MKKLILMLLLLVLTGCPFPWPTPDPDPDPQPDPTPIFQSKLGRAPYAIQSANFDCNAFYNSLSAMRAYSIAYLANTFGNNRACLDRVFADPKFRAVEVHLFNEVCAKYPRCGSYEAYYGLSVSQIQQKLENKDLAFMARLTGFAQIEANYLLPKLNARPDVQCIISPSLESNVSVKAMTNLVTLLKPIFPGCKFVTPQPGTGVDYIESHNPYATLGAPCIFNNDGYNISFPGLPSSYDRNIQSSEIPSVNHRMQACDYIFFWISDGDNCITQGPFQDPRSRSCKEIRRHGMLGKDLAKLQGVVFPDDPAPGPVPGPTPTPGINPTCSDKVYGPDGPNNFLWKPVAESRPGLVILFPSRYKVKFDSVSVVTNGGSVERGTFSGFTNPDRQTWRFSKPGKDYTGTVAVVNQGNHCQWKVNNPSQRQD